MEDKRFYLKCPICNFDYNNLYDVEDCFEKCKFIIKCYMEYYKIEEKEAIEMFLMELM